MADDFEADLEVQLASQREALASIESALIACGVDLSASGANGELLQMRIELSAAVSELESALLEIKRARILQELAASAAGPSTNTSADDSQPAALATLPTAAVVTSPSCSSNDTTAAALAASGARCHFRYMDGRWYAGRFHGPGRQAGTVSVSFEVPTRSFMLDPVDVMEALIRPLRGNTQPHVQGQRPQQPESAAVGATAGVVQYGDLAVGRRALAQLPGSRLYVPVEVVALDAARATATLLPLQNSSYRCGGGNGGGAVGGAVVVPIASVTRHAHVTAAEVGGPESTAGGDGWEGVGGGSDTDGDGDDGGSSSSVSALLRTGVGGAGSGSEGDEGDGSGDDGEGNEDEDEDVDMYGSDADDGAGDVGDGDDGGGDGDGLDVFGHARLAAERGTLDDSALLADWEAHSRGVASRLLTRMGYRRGRGLGSRGQGAMAAPEVLLLPERRGLGAVDKDRVRRVGGPVGSAKLSGGVAKRRKRGGARQRRKKAIVAVREARREVREQEQGAPGGGGLFDFINSSLGDSSIAARIRKAQVAVEGMAAGRGAAGGGAATAGAAAIAGATAAAGRGEGHRAPSDRRGLMSHHDTVAGIQTKLGRLQEMLGRNRENRGLRTQLEAQIRGVKAELAEAQSAAARASKAIHDKDAQKKWLKF